MKQHSQLWFIAIVPPEIIREEVKAFKELAKLHFGSGHALRSPAHITLFPPFKWENSELPLLEGELSNFSALQKSFYLTLRGFDCFPPRVIFVDLLPSTQLNKLQKHLVLQLATTLKLHHNSPYGFHPHMTVAFKDLRRSKFAPAWNYFKLLPYEQDFEVEGLYLLHHQQNAWVLHKYFEFKEKGM